MLGVHVLVLLRLLERIPRRAAPASAAPALTWLDLSRVASSPPRAPAAARPVRPATPLPVAPRAAAEGVPGAPSAIDWADAARDAIRHTLPPAPDCRPRAALERLPPGCPRPARPFSWNPEPPRAGFEGGLPYVRLKNCVLGLGFFGCAFGRPAANAHLFDDLRNPDRPRSSVPDNPRRDAY
ncbi:MAG: hypothetical protein JOZ67_04480 [Gammaproteobacteria bacterium]|nr:hypothetical protein [Gammaproteobacteria bacterium]MBV9697163.1 hypothetical protein [Gammaproteobacteria bacterium]